VQSDASKLTDASRQQAPLTSQTGANPPAARREPSVTECG
jgi:hypothetical protein